MAALILRRWCAFGPWHRQSLPVDPALRALIAGGAAGLIVSIDAVAAVLKANIRPASHKLAAIQLAEGTNQRTGVVWRSMASIAACLGISERQAKRVMRKLQADGIVLVLANGAGGAPGTVPVYRINAARLIELTPACQRTGDTNVILLGVMGGHARPNGCHPESATGDANVTRTGIGTRREPKDAGVCASHESTAGVAEPMEDNSRDPEGQRQAVDDARRKLQQLAEQFRQRPDLAHRG